MLPSAPNVGGFHDLKQSTQTQRLFIESMHVVGKQGHLSNSLEKDKYSLKREPTGTIAAVSIQLQCCKNRHSH